MDVQLFRPEKPDCAVLFRPEDWKDIYILTAMVEECGVVFHYKSGETKFERHVAVPLPIQKMSQIESLFLILSAYDACKELIYS